MTKFLHTSVVEIHLPDDRDLFDLTGNLSGNRKALFWHELNRLVRQLDIKEKEKQQQTDMDQRDKGCSTPPWLAHS